MAAPRLVGFALDPTGLVEMSIGVTGDAALAVDYATGLVLFPVGYVLVFRPLLRGVAAGLPWLGAGLLYGLLLWVVAMYVVASLVGGMPPFMGFEPVAWASLIGHIGMACGISLLAGDPGMRRRKSLLAAGLGAAAFVVLAIRPAAAEDDGLVTVRSHHAVRETIDRFEAAVRAAGWKVFTEIDHAAAAHEAGLSLGARTVILFGNPKTGTGAMELHPTLALDLPLRVLVWRDGDGTVFVTRSSGEDIADRIFARHGMAIPAEHWPGNDATLADLVRHAVE